MFQLNVSEKNQERQLITSYYRANETECLKNLLSGCDVNEIDNPKATDLARKLIKQVRNKRIKGKGVDALMQEFRLSTDEGIALMCLAESLLRIPDKETQDQLIRDKITKGDWSSHTKTDSLFVNAASWGLLITGKLVASSASEKLYRVLLKLVAKGGEPLIRKAVATAVRFMGNQFVMGETIGAALKLAVDKEKHGYQFSYDMLGEAAMNDEDAMRYMQSYIDAIHCVGKANNGRGVFNGPGISVKLSAIHPRYIRAKQERVITELYPRLKQLYILAKQYQIGLFIDAEEADRLELSLDLLEMLTGDPDLLGFKGIGFVIQAYQKRAPYVIDYVAALAKRTNHRLLVRLVKGAYWDSEIKRAQVDGQDDYPVFTRKFYTDLSYLVCAKKLFENHEYIYPLFATHNAYTLASVYQMSGGREFEFQCLYGMGETLYDNVVGVKNLNITCRVYAPVGTHETLLAYLVRRLLENGANSSFVHQLVDKDIPIDDLLLSPIELSRKANYISNPYFNLPSKIYPDGRINSQGMDLSNDSVLAKLQVELDSFSNKKYLAYPLLVDKDIPNRETLVVKSPANQSDIVGEVIKGTLEEVDYAAIRANAAFEFWAKNSPHHRAQILLRVADLLEENYTEVLSLLVREAGKTLNNAISEVREAVDFCRYYAKQVITEFENDTHKPLGIFVAISPWNFPLAIFMGEVCSAIVAGNTVIAKPSYQTNLIAFYTVNLFYQAGLPRDVLQFMPGSGSVIGDALTKHELVVGVIFTGSTEVAKMINQNLATRDVNAVLIAETGGQNTMIVDSSSLPEQVVTDVITSGFDSAGQRCSALRVLYLQADIADKVIQMLKGAMNELRVGDPVRLDTDVGPVIDLPSQKGLLTHIEKMKKQARMFYQAPLSTECSNGIFVAPTLVEIGSIKELEHEVFGPVVHVIRFDADRLDSIIDEINSSGYGLTQGVHSRIETVTAKVAEKIHAGNVYINRNMVGAVVGVQPFGGEGLSGTGPKAGGPFYLYRLVNTLALPRLNTTWFDYKLNALDSFVNELNLLGLNPQDDKELRDYIDKIRHQSLLTQRVNLPGPTGESNTMFFKPRGYVLCAAGTKLDIAKQVACVLATDNTAIIRTRDFTADFGKIISAQIIMVDVSAASYPNVRAILIANSYPNKPWLRQKLAARDGCLLVNIYEQELGSYSLPLLLTERTISNNITATGGNVQLMSMTDLV